MPTAKKEKLAPNVKRTIVVIGLAIIIIVGFIFADEAKKMSDVFARQEKTTTIEGIFVDLNGDGLVDYLMYGEVIYNTTNFPERQ